MFNQMTRALLKQISLYLPPNSINKAITLFPQPLKRRCVTIDVMRLEDEIKQTKPFQDEFHKLEVNLIYTYHWMQARLEERLNGADITLQQYNILRILRGQYPNPATVMLLKERMLDRECDASRLVDRLVQKALVSRTLCPNDRRKVDVLITQKGLDLLKMIDQRESFLKKHASLSEHELQSLNALLDKLRG